MTEEELYREFLEISHMDEKNISRYAKIRNIKAGGEIVADGFEGLAIWIEQIPKFPLTYFHNPKLENKE